MSGPFDDVQRIVLVGSHWQVAQHLVLSFGDGSQPPHFLNQLMAQYGPTPADGKRAAELPLQVSLGFSRRGLERARVVPAHVMACFADKAPAFAAGAALRAASHLGLCGEDAPGRWEPAYGFMTLDAVLSLHAMTCEPLIKAVRKIKRIAVAAGVKVQKLQLARALPAPKDYQLVHFGYRDGLARVGIKGYTKPEEMELCLPASQFAAGEFVLGHAQESGANPWIASAGLRVWPEALRRFFHNGSFGVLQQIEQDVPAFEAFVYEAAKATKFEPVDIKARLCGRMPDGRPLATVPGTDPTADFDYTHDPDGLRCPFGSHVRRMNPRSPRPGGADAPATGLPAPAEGAFGSPAHDARLRPLLRRGMPYGQVWEHPPQSMQRGLMGLFFCASIEDQFEHLLGQWADRVPLGSPDGGGARDPLIGAHESGDGGFEIPMSGGRPLVLRGLRRFTRTCGAAYLFYPSISTLGGIAESSPFADLRGDDE